MPWKIKLERGGIAMSVVILMAAIATLVTSATLSLTRGWQVGCACGTIAFMRVPPSEQLPGLHFDDAVHQIRPWLIPIVDPWSLRALVAVPLWIPFSAVFIPTLALRRQNRGLAVGLCSKCNYDRRGLAVGAKCPECGTVPGGE